MVEDIIARRCAEAAARCPRHSPKDLEKELLAAMPAEWREQRWLARKWATAVARECLNRSLVQRFVEGRTPCLTPGCLRPGRRAMEGGRVVVRCLSCMQPSRAA